jgi:hypothetical protein
MYVYIENVLPKYMAPDHWHGVYTTKNRYSCWLFVSKEHTPEEVLSISETLSETERGS